MAERDCAAVAVRLRAVQPQLLLDGEVLARERLFDFDEVDLFELQVRLLKRLAYRGHGADAHDVGLDARVGPTDDAARGRQVLLFDVILARNDERGRAVHDAGGVARRDEAVLAKRRGELRQDFERSLWAQVVVHFDELRALARLHLAGRYLLREDARVLRALRLGLRAQGVGVLLLARDFVAAREVLGRARHRRVAVGVEQRDHQRVFELALTQAQAAARAVDDVRGHRHRLHAADERRARFVQQNHERAGDDRLDAAAAQTVDGQSRAVGGHARLQRDVARAVEG